MAIVFFTDFDSQGIYTGQMEAVIHAMAPEAKIIHSVNDAPQSDPQLSAYLLAALAPYFAQGSIFVAVVDPGVGGSRAALMVEADGRFFVGPDNGLFNSLTLQAEIVRWHSIVWPLDNCSLSFHGRDVFAPFAARLYLNQAEDYLQKCAVPDLVDWPVDLFRIIYFDHYGNAMTGIRYQARYDGLDLMVNGLLLKQAGTFCQVARGELFWYKNSVGLIEIAANRQSAKSILNLALGDEVKFIN